MSGSVNKVILIGHLGRDPEVRRLASGDPVVNLRVATTESWRDKQSGERRDKTEWHNVVIFNEGLAKIAEEYLSKGSKVYLEGQLQTRKFTDSAGAERYATEVVLQRFRGGLVMLSSGRGDDGDYYDTGHDPRPQQRTGSPNSYQQARDGEVRGSAGAPRTRAQHMHDVLDDNIPF